MKIIGLAIFIYFSYISTSFAYLDPGSGSLIVQSIIAFLATVGATLAIWWKQLKNKIKNLFSKKKKSL